MSKPQLYLALILITAALLRFWQLDQIPSGFIPEEVSTGWNAYSLLKTGRDEWGVLAPIIFRETGGFKLALNSYLIVPVMAVLGPTVLAVRLPTAVAGLLAVWLTYVLVRQLWWRKSYALTAALLLAISPWHVSMGRYAVDVNWGIPLFLGGLILLLRCDKRPKLFIAAAILFGLTYYTYFNYVVFTLLFLVLFSYARRDLFWSSGRWKWGLLFFALQFIFLSPYIFATNLTVRFSQVTTVEQVGRLNRIHEHRKACLNDYPLAICRLLYNRPVARGMELARNYVNHYSTTPLFLYGSQLGLSGMPDRWGFFYLFEFPLLVYGLWVLVRRKQLPAVLVLWGILYGVPSSLAGEAHIWRMMTLLPLPQLIAGVGLVEIVRLVAIPGIRIGVIGAIGGLLLMFLVDYTSYFPYAQSAHSYYGFREVYAYAESIADNYEQVVVAPMGLGFEQLYIYYVFYTQFDPRLFQQGIDVERRVGEQNWVEVSRVGKWHFVSDVRNVIFDLPDNTLLITDGNFNEKEPLPKQVMLPSVIHTIDYANGDPAFKIVELTKNPEYKKNSNVKSQNSKP